MLLLLARFVSFIFVSSLSSSSPSWKFTSRKIFQMINVAFCLLFFSLVVLLFLPGKMEKKILINPAPWKACESRQVVIPLTLNRIGSGSFGNTSWLQLRFYRLSYFRDFSSFSVVFGRVGLGFVLPPVEAFLLAWLPVFTSEISQLKIGYRTRSVELAVFSFLNIFI